MFSPDLFDSLITGSSQSKTASDLPYLQSSNSFNFSFDVIRMYTKPTTDEGTECHRLFSRGQVVLDFSNEGMIIEFI